MAAGVALSLTPQIANSAAKVTQGATCKPLNKKTTYQKKDLHLHKEGQ